MSQILNYTSKNQASILKFESLVTKSKVEFPAFLTTFSQTFNSNWNSEQVYGRSDPIGNFQGTQRVINVGWDVPSGQLEEAKANLEFIDTLIQMLYPAYDTSTFSVDVVTKEAIGETPAVTETRIVGGNAFALAKPPLIRLQYGNLIRAVTGNIAGATGLLGWVGNLSWTPNMEMGMFTEGKKQYPKVIGLSLDFTVLHEHDLGTFKGGGGTPATFPFGG